MSETTNAGGEARDETDVSLAEKPSQYARLNARQRDALYVIHALDEPNGSEIGAELGSYRRAAINSNSLYPMLDDLVELGLVERTHPDGRSNAYALTSKGIRILGEREAWTTQYWEGDK